jgi:hypothetical protein
MEVSEKRDCIDIWQFTIKMRLPRLAAQRLVNQIWAVCKHHTAIRHNENLNWNPRCGKSAGSENLILLNI